MSTVLDRKGLICLMSDEKERKFLFGFTNPESILLSF